MAGALPFISAAGGAVQAVGALDKGQMTANSLNAQAGMQQKQAQEAEQAGAYNAFRSGVAATQSLGRATAAYGASGVAAGSTSEQSVLMAGAQNAELDRQNILHGADLNAINHENQASLDSFGANSALEGSYMSALGSALGAGAGVASSYVGSSTGGGGGVSTEDPGLSANPAEFSGP